MLRCCCWRKGWDEEQFYELTNPKSDAVKAKSPEVDAYEKKEVGPKNSDALVENQLMYMTETVSGSSRPNSLHISLSTIFSISEELSTSPVESLHSRLGDVLKGQKGYYTLTLIPPNSQSTQEGSSASNPVSSVSTISSKAKCSHPVQRIKLLRGSGSAASATSRMEGSVESSTSKGSYWVDSVNDVNVKLSNITEASSDDLDDSVFERPDTGNPYYPNHNTPVDEYECGVVMMNAPFCPPNNTPVETSDSEHGTLFIPKSASKCTKQRHDTYFVLNEVHPGYSKSEQKCVHVVTDSSGTASLSIHSQDLNSTAVPIHCSTIAGAEEPVRHQHIINPFGTEFHDYSDDFLPKMAAKKSPKLSNVTVSSDVSQLTVATSIDDTKFQWHYNKAYVHDDSKSAVEQKVNSTLQLSFVEGCIDAGMSYQVNASSQTSIIAQAGSREASAHISNTYGPHYPASAFTDSTVSLSSRQVHSRRAAVIPLAPANSPQTLYTKSFEHFINRMSCSSHYFTDETGTNQSQSSIPQSERSRHLTTNSRQLHAPSCTPAHYISTHHPQLSPKTYWV